MKLKRLAPHTRVAVRKRFIPWTLPLFEANAEKILCSDQAATIARQRANEFREVRQKTQEEYLVRDSVAFSGENARLERRVYETPFAGCF
jgi:hypothetical protein